jgi:hypothetical protein
LPSPSFIRPLLCRLFSFILITYLTFDLIAVQDQRSVSRQDSSSTLKSRQVLTPQLCKRQGACAHKEGGMSTKRFCSQLASPDVAPVRLACTQRGPKRGHYSNLFLRTHACHAACYHGPVFVDNLVLRRSAASVGAVSTLFLRHRPKSTSMVLLRSSTPLS